MRQAPIQSAEITRARAYRAGWAYALDHDFRPCLHRLKLDFRYSQEEAEAFAQGYLQAMRERGRCAETRCPCTLSSPFKS